ALEISGVSSEDETQYLAYNTDFDYCPANPNVMYRVGHSHNNHQHFAKTISGGKTNASWQVMSSSMGGDNDRGPLKQGGETIKIAVSASDANNVVATGTTTNGLYVTTDGGISWKKIKGGLGTNSGLIEQHGTRAYGTDKPLCADRKNGKYFYGYRNREIWVSNNKGLPGSWRKKHTFPNQRSPNDWRVCAISLVASPNNAGHLAINLGSRGLWLSKDFGDNWTKNAQIVDARAVGFGKKAAGSKFSTLYVHGKKSGIWGIYRSTDYGKTWIRITPSNKRFNSVSNITGSMRTFGIVYFNTSGSGIVMGRASSTAGSRITADATSAERTDALFQEISTRSISRLYPNPTKGKLQIILPEQQLTIVQIYDTTGYRKLAFTLTENKEVDVSVLPAGLYLVSIQQNDLMERHKLLIQ
ncbi:MAG: T9SS type A sorting domain-containing protein, partial [Bacteroidota bacterium]